jgi:hypothetical protein
MATIEELKLWEEQKQGYFETFPGINLWRFHHNTKGTFIIDKNQDNTYNIYRPTPYPQHNTNGGYIERMTSGTIRLRDMFPDIRASSSSSS